MVCGPTYTNRVNKEREEYKEESKRKDWKKKKKTYEAVKDLWSILHGIKEKEETRMVLRVCNLSSWMVQAGVPGVQGQPHLHREFKASL